MRIVETDNFDGDYSGESFLNIPSMNEEQCKVVANIINQQCSGDYAPRYWKVVENDYKLRPSFEP